MTDTTLVDAVVAPQDDGTGVSSGSEDYTSAGYFSLLSKYKGDSSYVGEDSSGNATLQFANVDTSNEQVDLQSGFAYIMDGSHSVQSGAQTSYDTNLPNDVPYVVIVPSGGTNQTNIDLDTDAVNDIWLAVDPSSNDSVYLRHGSGLSAPSDPSVKLGTVDTSSGDTTRANDLANITSSSVTTPEINNDVRVRPSDDFASVINNATTDSLIVVEEGTHGPYSTPVDLKDGQTLLIRGDITWSPSDPTLGGLGDGIRVEGTSSDKIEDVTIQFDGGSIVREQNTTFGQCITGFHMRRCELINADVDGQGSGLPVYWGGSESDYISEDCWIRGGYFRGPDGNNPPVEFAGVDGGGVVGVQTDAAGGTDALHVVQGQNLTVANNTTRNAGDEGLKALRISQSAIVGNVTLDAGQGLKVGGDASSNRRYNTVAGNALINPTNQGIELLGDLTNVTSNLVYNAGAEGIKDTDRGRLRNHIANNYIIGCQSGILAEGLETAVVGNNLHDIARWGIRLVDPRGMTCQGNVINGVNTTSGGYHGIETTDAGNSGNGGSSITYNMVKGLRGAPNVGIKTVSSSPVNVVSGNYVDFRATTRYDINGSGFVTNNMPEVPLDVRNLSGAEGNTGYHDGSGSNTTGPAFYNGSSWISTVDGTTIS